MDPLVCALVTAHDCAAFIDEAVESALAQDYPADRLRVVVVDDGSTDGTAERLAAHRSERVTVVRQPHAGYVAATNRALAEADGDLFALLDGDDVWPRDKIRRQVEELARRPEAGLIYGDMTVIDAAGDVIQESWLEGETPPEGRPFAALMAGNLATSSSIVIRAELARALAPIPSEVHFADWYLALRAARESEIAYLPEPRTLYRYHGANMSLGSSGARRERELRKSLGLQRWFLNRLRPGDVPADEVRAAWRSHERFKLELRLEAAGAYAAPSVSASTSRCAGRAAS